jgi:fukutin-related protein
MLKNNDFCSRETKKCETGTDGTKKPRVGGLDKGFTKPCCINAIKEICFYLVDLFEEQEIKYWLDFGTLLGAARNGEIIPWDKDADFGVFHQDIERIIKLAPRIKKDGFIFKKHAPGIYQVNYSEINRNFVDLFTWNLWTKDNSKEKWRHGFLYGISGINAHKYFPSYFVENTEFLKFYNKPARVPQDYEKFLELRFGKEWKTPRRVWDRKNRISNNEIRKWCEAERNWVFREDQKML